MGKPQSQVCGSQHESLRVEAPHAAWGAAPRKGVKWKFPSSNASWPVKHHTLDGHHKLARPLTIHSTPSPSQWKPAKSSARSMNKTPLLERMVLRRGKKPQDKASGRNLESPRFLEERF